MIAPRNLDFLHPLKNLAANHSQHGKYNLQPLMSIFRYSYIDLAISSGLKLAHSCDSGEAGIRFDRNSGLEADAYRIYGISHR
jgi:hypothetical protein